jgi:pimeloyl-ACP methyl ester carboxylesterase
MYPDNMPATVCAGDDDPNSFEDFRMAIIRGGQSRHINIERADCIENRLAKLLIYLRPRRPKEDWGQFLNPDGTIKWEAIAVSGQSQGGGHAALIAIKHRVARVICTGAPKDYSRRLDAPAAWYGDGSATPKSCFFTFNHRQDIKGCTPEHLLRNMAALKLDAFGPPIDAATEPYPYRHTRILTTSYPAVTVDGESSVGAKTAHTSVIANANASRWNQVWTYMLTEAAP